MTPRFWRDATRRQRAAVTVAALSLASAFGLLTRHDREPSFVCARSDSSRPYVLGGAPGSRDAIETARTYCTGDIAAAAAKLIRIYGIELFETGQKISLPED